MRSPLRIIVTGLIGQHPLGGMAWHYLQYVLGLARLGYDVHYLEDRGSVPSYAPAKHNWSPTDCTPNVQYLSDVMSHFHLGDKWAYRCSAGPRWFGLSDERRRAVIKSADLLLNVSGSLGQPENYRRVPRLAYIDTDPVFTQLRHVLGDRDVQSVVGAHDVHFSFGERVAQKLPATGHRWRPTRQPIVLSEWHPAPRQQRQVFTTVMNWIVKTRPLVHAGRAYYMQKEMEFMRFVELPAKVAPAVMELAVVSRKMRGEQRGQLVEHGWNLVDPQQVCPDYDSYRRYIQSSMAEWSVAKNGYVQGQTAWFSERSACYLAAGRPVIAQDTGFAEVLPVGEGLLSFRTMDEAIAAIDDVVAHYPRHVEAARDIAAQCFDSDRVLDRLIEEAMSDDAGVAPEPSSGTVITGVGDRSASLGE